MRRTPLALPFNRSGVFVGLDTGVAPPFVVAIWDDLGDMELIAKERDRLLQRTARFLGLAGTIIALIDLSFPGVVHMGDYFAVLPFLALLIVCQILVPRNHPVLWAAIGVTAGLVALVVLRYPFDETPSSSLGTAVIPLAGAGIAC